MSYSLGQPENAPVAPGPPNAPPYDVRRGFIMVPSRDLRDYVAHSLVIAAAGFAVGVGVGAFFGKSVVKK